MLHSSIQSFKVNFIRIILINSLLAVASFEILSVFFLKEKLRILFGEYLQSPKSFGRLYPRYYFKKDPEKGFDIIKNSQKLISHKPREIDPYPIWGNNIGCFDNDIKKNSKYSIYLAGDSFTWG